MVCLLNGCCRRPTILELWNNTCVNIHCPLPFQSSKMIYRLGMCHPACCTCAYKINVPGHPCTICSTCCHQWSNILCIKCSTCRGQPPTLLKLWSGNCVNAHAPSLFQVPTHIVALDGSRLVAHVHVNECLGPSWHRLLTLLLLTANHFRKVEY